MEGEGLGDDALLRKLRNSRRSFQRRMQQLMEKVRVPAALRGEEDGAGASAGAAGAVQKTPEVGAGRASEVGEGDVRGGVSRRPGSCGRLPSPVQGLPLALGLDRTPFLSPQYNQPFEDAPLVHMSTLTYETPQGTECSPVLIIYG